MPTKMTKEVVRTLDLIQDGEPVTVKMDTTGISVRLGRQHWKTAKTLEWKALLAALFKPVGSDQ